MSETSGLSLQGPVKYLSRGFSRVWSLRSRLLASSLGLVGTFATPIPWHLINRSGTKDYDLSAKLYAILFRPISWNMVSSALFFSCRV